MQPLRIAIHAELAPGTQAGGTQSVLIGLVDALAGLADGDERYVFACHPDNDAWLKPHLGANMEIVHRPQKKPAAGWRGALQKRAGRLLRRISGEQARQWPEVPRSDGFYESLGCDVLHFPWQQYFVCALPTIFNPHDLLHLHYPQYFQPKDIVNREALYPVACRLAHTVVVCAQWTKDDVASHYSLDPRKVQVIPYGCPTSPAAKFAIDVNATRARFNLPETFAFYPAVTWEHKNHLRLLQALALLRDRENLQVRLVCTGHRFERHWVKVQAELRRLGLQDQVTFLGEVPLADLCAIYRAAEFVVVPTLFEAASGPVFEAWNEGAPVACSNVTSLPQQAGDAALIFDPWSTEAIADALKRMASEPALREDLRAKGRRRLGDFDWDRTARAYRAVYRRAARAPLSPEDRELLSWDWMLSSRP